MIFKKYRLIGIGVASCFLASLVQAYDCTSLPQFIDGQSYAGGQKVKNVNHAYSCTVGGWCSVGGAYEPGVGWAWENSWSDLGSCGAATSSSKISVASSSVKSSISNSSSKSTSSNSATKKLNVNSVSDSGNDGNIPQNTLDGNLATRWSAFGSDQWINYDLGKNVTFNFARIAWYSGNVRVENFDIQISSDNSHFTTVFSGLSSGTTTAIETYNVSEMIGRYVRIVGYGNSVNAWNSIAETEFWGNDNADTQAPTAPVNLTAAVKSSSEIILDWSNATDNVGVAGYNIYRNGNKVGSTQNITYTDIGLSAATSYGYSVKAYDAAGNISNSSNNVAATTQTGQTTGLNPRVAPGGNFNLSLWMLQLPTGSSGSVTTISANQLAGAQGYQNSYYFYTDTNDGAMVLMDPTTGATTSGSKHPRTELHENTSGWSTAGTNLLSVQAQVVQVPSSVCVGQIFQAAPAPSKPLLELMYFKDGTIKVLLEATNQGGTGAFTTLGSIPAGSKFSYELSLTGTTIKITINGVAHNFALPASFIGEKFYFKAGAYDQSATSGTPGTKPGTLVKIYALNVTHK